MKGFIRCFLISCFLISYIEVCFLIPREIRRQGRETRRLIIEMVHLESISKRGPLHEAGILFDDDFVVTNLVGEAANKMTQEKYDNLTLKESEVK